MELLVPATGPINTPLTAHRPNPLTPTTKTTVFFRKIQSFSNPFPRIASNGRKPILTRVSSSSSSSSSPSVSSSTVVGDSPSVSSASSCSRWMVVMEKPVNAGSSKSEIIDYYVETLARVLGSEKEAQMCIYDASWQTQFGFCCDIDEEASRELVRLPGVLSVRPDRELESEKKDYSYSNFLIGHLSKSNGRASKFSPSEGNYEYWLVQMEKPGVEVVTKAQMVDYYAQTLTKVLGNEKDAEVSIYNISWEKDFGFCCQIDEECARELADVPGVLSVRPDMNYESENKDYKGDANSQKSTDLADSSEADKIPAVKTKGFS